MDTGPTNRRYAIGDIHGCLQTLRQLLENKIKIEKTDCLYFLGDYIDRGPDSPGVLDYLIGLKKKGHRLETLRGNHEENLLKAQAGYDPETFRHYVIKLCKSPGLLDNNLKIKKKYRVFFAKMPYYIELDDYFLVHAGFDFNKPNPFKNQEAMLEMRNPTANNQFLKNKTLVHGHQPAYLNKIKKAVREKNQVIPLDNGCVYTKPHKIYDYTQLGNLCCLNLDTQELVIQKNVDT